MPGLAEREMMMTNLMAVPSEDDEVCQYDLRNLALYASLMDAADAGLSWQVCAHGIMGLDDQDLTSLDLFERHLRRARWIVGKGLQPALIAFTKGI
ncbi:hypothetical protein K3M67_14025 [Sphingobium sp. V4]|uniref:hypothetical protein n=1 Tax=Sphingobium sp. V4 TaxID=3038927 RepID=UPI002557FDF4|nr:hypothetical protein [Sphingobium sp. V4]WIW88061.1 hypothetical protein K3M67_14025 [Sphingobium sp. V4]